MEDQETKYWFKHGSSSLNVGMNLLIAKSFVAKRRVPKSSITSAKIENVVREKAKFSIRIPIREGSATAPAELLAAALARSFSLALTSELGLKACAVGEIVTTATATLQKVSASWIITNIHLHVVARLPKVTQGKFIDATVCAKTKCMVSRSLRANISMEAKLEK